MLFTRSPVVLRARFSGDSSTLFEHKTPITPEEIFRAIGRLRKEARDEIDRLIRFLDETDYHMAIDCEPEEDGEGEDAEPSLGSFDRMTDQSKAWRTSGSLWAYPRLMRKWMTAIGRTQTPTRPSNSRWRCSDGKGTTLAPTPRNPACRAATRG